MGINVELISGCIFSIHLLSSLLPTTPAPHFGRLWQPHWLWTWGHRLCPLHTYTSPSASFINNMKPCPVEWHQKSFYSGTSLVLSGKESTCWCTRHGFDPWSGKTPRATEQLSPRATTTDLAGSRARGPRARTYPGARALQREKRCSEKPEHRN